MSLAGSDAGPIRHRLSELLGAQVIGRDGASLGRVRDVRLGRGSRLRGAMSELIVTGMLISRRQFGATLGYEREQTTGPWIITVIMRRIHRDARMVNWDEVDHIDWDNPAMVYLSRR